MFFKTGFALQRCHDISRKHCVCFLFPVSGQVSSSTISVMRRILTQDGIGALFAGRNCGYCRRTSCSPPNANSSVLLCFYQVFCPGWSKWLQPVPSWSAVTSSGRLSSENTTRKGSSGLCTPAAAEGSSRVFLSKAYQMKLLHDSAGGAKSRALIKAAIKTLFMNNYGFISKR